MHPRNRHQSRYDFKQLTLVSPLLKDQVFVNRYGDETIDFSSPEAVKLLNQAILKSSYGLRWWDLPANYLCPPIPGRADYIHHLADLLKGQKDVLIWDVGVGANCVYPLIGHSEYQWKFIGSEIDPGALASAEKILKENSLEHVIDLRLQMKPETIFTDLLLPTDKITATMCNPPFHASAEEAAQGTQRKLKNLGLRRDVLNFGGKNHELWCPGGELGFVSQMMEESREYAQQCQWFTSLISKSENLPPLKKKLQTLKASEVEVLEMSQGQKISRILAWSFR